MDRTAMLQEAGSIGEVARAHAEETESLHRLAPPVADAIVASPLADAWRPVALGGNASHPGHLIEAIETIALGDASAAWCAGIAFGAIALSAVVPEATAKDFFADRRVGMGTFGPTGRLTESGDGYNLAGRWGFASNCQQASWAATGFMRFKDGAPVMGPGGPQTGMAFIHREQFDIDETWDMSGLCGTGSHDIVVDTQIPEGQTSDLFAAKWPDDALFRMRMFDLLAPCQGVVALGIGEAALAAAREHIAATGDQPQRGPKPPFGIDPMNQAAFGRAETHVRSARAYLYDCLDEAYEHAQRGDVPPKTASARIFLALFEGYDAAVEAVTVASQILGTASAREGSPVDRMRRDLQALSGHIALAPLNRAVVGRQAAGLDTVAWPFFPPEPD